MQEIRLTYFFLPIRLQVLSNPGADEVVVDQRTILGTFEFLRLPVQAAHAFAELLETTADNASQDPIVSGQVGEISGKFVRSLGTGTIRIRLSPKRLGTVRLSIKTAVGLKSQYSRPTISVEETLRFASSLRQANVDR